MAPRQPIARRLLFPSLPHDSPLPPLLLSPLASPDLNSELYDFIALALRAFVVPWWSKISRYDKDFIPQVTRVLTTVIRVLETRILAADFLLVILRHVPAILTQHYRDYRNVSAKLSTSYAAGGAASLPHLFHQIQPHMAVSSDGRIDPEYLRQLVDLILNVCLPDEDFQPDAERFIIREVIIKVVLNDVIPKITQPWFIEQTLLRLLETNFEVHSTTSRLSTLFLTFFSQVPPRSSSPSRPSSFSFHALLVIFLSAIQYISGACLALIEAYKQTLNTIKRVNQIQPESKRPTSPSPSTPNLSLPSPTLSSQLPVPGNYATSPLIMISEIFTLRDRIASNTLLTTAQILTTLSSSFLDRYFLLFSRLFNH
jgi:hypothetical protein